MRAGVRLRAADSRRTGLSSRVFTLLRLRQQTRVRMTRKMATAPAMGIAMERPSLSQMTSADNIPISIALFQLFKD